MVLFGYGDLLLFPVAVLTADGQFIKNKHPFNACFWRLEGLGAGSCEGLLVGGDPAEP